ncbi:unnamed protein product [Allacma fusca]|uniref:BTB domain-containing protein n=1 Tax=Allacma fusca TaxID=39272 RepID=A0A8J2P024_9HEXA|nr:unnamed protein product [Allacma fusca]
MDLESTDILLMSKDCKPIRAHQAIIAARSPKIREMIISTPSQSLVRLDDINYEQLKIIIELMYTNKCTLPSNLTSDDVENLKHVLIDYGVELSEEQTTL